MAGINDLPFEAAVDLCEVILPPGKLEIKNMNEMLRPIPVALASCTRFFQAMLAMRESFATLQELRVGHPSASLPSTPASANDPQRASADSDCITPPHWRKDPSFDELSTKSTRKQQEQQLYHDRYGEATDSNEFGSNGLRRLTWPPPVKKEHL